MASGSFAAAMDIERGPSEGQQATRRFTEEAIRENMRAVIDGLFCHKAAVTDELSDGRLKLANWPGARRWGEATLEVYLAILQSAAERKEISNGALNGGLGVSRNG